MQKNKNEIKKHINLKTKISSLCKQYRLSLIAEGNSFRENMEKKTLDYSYLECLAQSNYTFKGKTMF